MTAAHEQGEVLTGVFYVNTKAPSFMDVLHVTDEPLATLPQAIVRPPKQALDEIMGELR
jgi:2-oxoglutarate ferredoxin oxidoreductase subunit beta